MPKIDRLTTLIETFRISASLEAPKHANLFAIKDKKAGQISLYLHPHAVGHIGAAGDVLFALYIEFNQLAPALAAALPHGMSLEVEDNQDLAHLVQLIAAEVHSNRCGAKAVIARYGEILVVRLLRHQLENGHAKPSFLAGLADDRISRALVAIHERPERLWNNEALAQEAGLSPSRFKQLFAQLVCETPGSYLRRWRLMLAKTEIERGERIDKVARRYGYRAPDAFSRAYLKEYGYRPKRTSTLANQ
jgi:AraC-like DNA-binding protein